MARAEWSRVCMTFNLLTGSVANIYASCLSEDGIKTINDEEMKPTIFRIFSHVVQ